MHITRRQLFGFFATALLAGCSQPEPPVPPLPMGPPLEKSTSSSTKDEAVNLGDTPPHFQVKFETSKGDFVVEVHSHWSPNGASHFYELVKNGFYDDCRFFRVLPDFMVQWGINGDPKVNAKWHDANIPDDRPTGENKKSNLRGFITYAKTGAPNSRSTQLFINYADNSRLDSQGFTPFGQVIEGMDVVEKINAKHREEPQQDQINARGNEYLNEKFPDLDFIKKATLVDSNAAPTESAKNADEPK
jgi:peptidyl-prolyl cis-trans isomerase A (cyclophilin A)